MSYYSRHEDNYDCDEFPSVPNWQKRGCTCHSASESPCRYCDWKDYQDELAEAEEAEESEDA